MISNFEISLAPPCQQSRPHIHFGLHHCQGQEELKVSGGLDGWGWGGMNSGENGSQLMRQVLPKSRAIDSLAAEHD